MSQLELFDISEYATSQRAQPREADRRCLHCCWRQRWQMGGTVVQYCTKRSSRRTLNGLRRIKCKDEACELWVDVRRRLDDVYHYSEEEERVLLSRTSNSEAADQILRTRGAVAKKRQRLRRVARHLPAGSQ